MLRDLIVRMVDEGGCKKIFPADTTIKQMHVRMPIAIFDRFSDGDTFRVEKIVTCESMYCAFGMITVLGKVAVTPDVSPLPKIGESVGEFSIRLGISFEEAERIFYG